MFDLFNEIILRSSSFSEIYGSFHFYHLHRIRKSYKMFLVQSKILANNNIEPSIVYKYTVYKIQSHNFCSISIQVLSKTKQVKWDSDKKANKHKYENVTVFL